MRIGFLTSAHHGVGSVRIRADIPARELRSMGHSVYVGPTLRPDRQVFVITKTWHGTIEQLREHAGARVVCDMNDDFSHVPQWVERMKHVIANVDAVTVSCPALQQMFMDTFGVKPTVIDEPYEDGQSQAKWAPGPKLKILWFGHASNAQALIRVMPILERYGIVRAVCNAPIDGVDSVRWSREGQWRALEWADVVVIPVVHERRNNLPLATGKSADRMMSAIRRGRFVVAEPIESYKQFSDWMHVGDIEQGFRWLIGQPQAQIVSRIEAAQAYVSERFNPRRIAKQWENVLLGVCGTSGAIAA